MSNNNTSRNNDANNYNTSSNINNRTQQQWNSKEIASSWKRSKFLQKVSIGQYWAFWLWKEVEKMITQKEETIEMYESLSGAKGWR